MFNNANLLYSLWLSLIAMRWMIESGADESKKKHDDERDNVHPVLIPEILLSTFINDNNIFQYKRR